MPTLNRIESGPETWYYFHCPGCGGGHAFRTAAREGSPVWTFNGDEERPTFSPSLLVDKSRPEKRCHLFVRDGKIQYLNDCHHHLAGQTVDMIELE